MNKVSLLLIAAVALVFTGCEKKPDAAAEAPIPTKTSPAADKAADRAEAKVEAVGEKAKEKAEEAADKVEAKAEEAKPAAEAGGDLPAACKEYADKMLKCLESDKYPAAAKDGAKQGLEAMKTGWNFGAMDGAAKDAAMNAANDACTQSVNAMKQSGEMMCPGVW